MEFELDSAKDKANQKRHGLSLSFGTRTFEDPDHLIVPTIRKADEEERYKVIGEVGGKLYTAVHVWWGQIVRFISVRRSNASEERAYHSD